MELSQTSLAVFFAVMLACGAFLGIVYDLTAILPAICGRVFDIKLNERLGGIYLPLIKRPLKRYTTAHGRVSRTLSIFFHDLLFMITAGIVVSLVVYRFNDGRWRVGGLVCLCVGYAIYRVILRRLVLCFTELLRFAIRVLAAYIAFFVLLPIKWGANKLRVFYKMFRSQQIEKYIRQYSEKEKKRILRSTREGSLDGKIKFNGEKYARRKKEKSNSDLDHSLASFGVGNDSDTQSHEIEPTAKRSHKARA